MLFNYLYILSTFAYVCQCFLQKRIDITATLKRNAPFSLKISQLIIRLLENLISNKLQLSIRFVIFSLI